MMHIFTKLTGAVALAAIAGCSGGGGGRAPVMPSPDAPQLIPPESDPVFPVVNPGRGGNTGGPSNAIGYAAVTAFPQEWQSDSSTALFQPNQDGSVSVKIVSGPLAGQETIFTPSSGDGSSDSASDYMRVMSEDGERLVAVIASERGSDDSYYYAYRTTEGLTDNMPLSGKATYQGPTFGYGKDQYGRLTTQEGSFYADVDFGAASLDGNISAGGNRVTFDGAIAGNTFSSVDGSIAYSPAGLTEEMTLPFGPSPTTIQVPVSPDPNYANQTNSKVEGAFYGDSAASMGGTYVINGSVQGNMIGAFTAGRGDIQP